MCGKWKNNVDFQSIRKRRYFASSYDIYPKTAGRTPPFDELGKLKVSLLPLRVYKTSPDQFQPHTFKHSGHQKEYLANQQPLLSVPPRFPFSRFYLLLSEGIEVPARLFWGLG